MAFSTHPIIHKIVILSLRFCRIIKVLFGVSPFSVIRMNVFCERLFMCNIVTINTKYIEIVRVLEREIRTQYKNGDILASEHSLAQRYGGDR